MQQEALLPGTDAIPAGAIEISEYRGRWLVRQKRLDGSARRLIFHTVDEAFPQFLEWVDELRSELREQRRKTMAEFREWVQGL
jgi:hypothetical protein